MGLIFSLLKVLVATLVINSQQLSPRITTQWAKSAENRDRGFEKLEVES